jgi:transposase
MSSIMESMGRNRPRPRRLFTAQFKAEIVELCQRGDRSVGQVAKDFDLTETAVREWVKQAELDAGTRSTGPFDHVAAWAFGLADIGSTPCLVIGWRLPSPPRSRTE